MGGVQAGASEVGPAGCEDGRGVPEPREAGEDGDGVFLLKLRTEGRRPALRHLNSGPARLVSNS